MQRGSRVSGWNLVNSPRVLRFIWSLRKKRLAGPSGPGAGGLQAEGGGPLETQPCLGEGPPSREEAATRLFSRAPAYARILAPNRG